MFRTQEAKEAEEVGEEKEVGSNSVPNPIDIENLYARNAFDLDLNSLDTLFLRY